MPGWYGQNSAVFDGFKCKGHHRLPWAGLVLIVLAVKSPPLTTIVFFFLTGAPLLHEQQ